MQVVVCGDFFELPPVPERKDSLSCLLCGKPIQSNPPGPRIPRPADYPTIGIDSGAWFTCTGCKYPRNSTIKYAFQTKAWLEADFSTVILTKVHRQTDQGWVDMLTKIKHGSHDDAVLDFLDSLRRPLQQLNGVRPTRLYTHRANVQLENDAEFAKIPGDEFVSAAIDAGWFESGYAKDRGDAIPQADLLKDPYFDQIQAPASLHLKVDAQVMLLANVDPAGGLVNGSRGVVTGFVTCTREQMVKKPSDAGDSAATPATAAYFTRHARPGARR